MINDYLTILLITGMIGMYIWMQYLSHKAARPDDGGRHKYLRPAPPKDMLYDIPPMGSVVFGRYKGKYVCRCTEVEGAILASGGSGCGKSTTIVELYLLNCNRMVKEIIQNENNRKKRKQ